MNSLPLLITLLLVSFSLGLYLGAWLVYRAVVRAAADLLQALLDFRAEQREARSSRLLPYT
jgi:Flp pilus assembly protein TadG